MSVLGWLVLGLAAGWIGSHIVDNQGKGPLLDIVLGIAGAFVGGLLFSAIGASPITHLSLYSLFVAVTGSVIVLVGYHALRDSRRL